MSLYKKGLCGSCRWSIDKNFVLTISPASGGVGVLFNSAGFWPWDGYAGQIRKVVIKNGVIAGTDIGYLFGGMLRCDSFDVSRLNVSMARDMRGVFSGCSSLSDISAAGGWDVSHAEDLSFMFNDCVSLSDISPLSGWDIRNVRSMDHAFGGCSSLATASPLSRWDAGSLQTASGCFRKTPARETPYWFRPFAGTRNRLEHPIVMRGADA